MKKKRGSPSAVGEKGRTVVGDGVGLGEVKARGSLKGGDLSSGELQQQ